MNFEEVNPQEIKESYPKYFHENARYFQVMKNDDFLCYYGIINYEDQKCETFWILSSFNGHVITRGMILSLMNHILSLGFKEIYTWSAWERVIRIFDRLKKFKIEKTGAPFWDKDPSKTWFVRRA
jgi:hypothetical protein